MVTRTAVVLVDGEHHPPVVRRALSELGKEGTEPVLAVVLGGGEKLGAPGEAPELGVRAVWPPSGEHALRGILADESPDVVVDLSGEPIVSARRRLRLAAIVLDAGVPYEAPGLRYDPPALTPRSRRPAISVVARLVILRAGERQDAGSAGSDEPDVLLDVPVGDLEQDDAIDRLFARYKRLTPGRLYIVTPGRVKVRQLPTKE
jgi:predicted GTPase